jgi:peptide/nickel transport system substrate-binding protein
VAGSKTFVTVLVASALVVVAACSGDDDDDAEPIVSTAASVDEPAPSGGSTSPSDTAASDGAATPPGTASPGERRPEDPPDPVHGGTLVYGLEADSANAWAPYRTSCVTSCLAVLRGVSDTLFAVTAEGERVPNLVERVDHSDDYTEWTLEMRDGITFHDGAPLDGAAVGFNIDTCRASPLTATAYLPIEQVEAAGQVVKISLREPWVALPGYFTNGSCAFMFSPQWLGSLADVPQRDPQSAVYDAELAATPADGDAAAPVGLGPFVFESYTPGNGNSFRAVRNPDYWRGPNGITGEDLPYLDAIEYVVAVDEQSRSNSVRSGGFDMMMTSMGDTIDQFLDDGELEVNSSTRFGDTGYFLLNLAAGALDPEGMNADNPLLDVNCRRALAGAIDQERVSQERGAGLSQPANGPFPPGAVGYLEDTGYPKYDVAAAQADMETCLATLGTDSIEFEFSTTNDPFNIETNELVISMWQEAFGDQVRASITTVEQGQYIGLLLTGAYDAAGARGFGVSDPDQDRIGWHSTSATPVGQLALNVSRLNDPTIDTALDVIRSNPDPAARKEAAETINRQFGSQAYSLWLTWVLWGIISQPYVNGVQANVLPDGSEGIGLAFAGLHNINQMWCDDGACE